MPNQTAKTKIHSAEVIGNLHPDDHPVFVSPVKHRHKIQKSSEGLGDFGDTEVLRRRPRRPWLPWLLQTCLFGAVRKVSASWDFSTPRLKLLLTVPGSRNMSHLRRSGRLFTLMMFWWLQTPRMVSMEHTDHAAFLIFQFYERLWIFVSKNRFTASKAQLACSKEDPVTRWPEPTRTSALEPGITRSTMARTVSQMSPVKNWCGSSKTSLHPAPWNCCLSHQMNWWVQQALVTFHAKTSAWRKFWSLTVQLNQSSDMLRFTPSTCKHHPQGHSMLSPGTAMWILHIPFPHSPPQTGEKNGCCTACFLCCGHIFWTQFSFNSQ